MPNAARRRSRRSRPAGHRHHRLAHGQRQLRRPSRAGARALADAFGWPAGIVFSTGYQANLGAISALAGHGEFLLVDADGHASIHDALPAERATTIRFRHNDPENLARRLERLGEDAQAHAGRGRKPLQHAGRPRAADGDSSRSRSATAPWLIVDEAHSFGVFGPRGLGICAELGLLDRVDFIVGTFSKSLGGVGGFCVSRHADLELLRMASRPYIFTASPPPPVIAATRAALQRVLAGDDLRERLWRHTIASTTAVEPARLPRRRRSARAR